MNIDIHVQFRLIFVVLTCPTSKIVIFSHSSGTLISYGRGFSGSRFMTTLFNWLDARNHRGQALVVVLFFLFVLLGFAALSIDFGFFFSERNKLQAGGDAAALAAASDLDDAQARAEALVIANGIALADIDLVVTPGNYTADAEPAFEPGGTPENAVRVEITGEREAQFASVFGQDIVTLSITATALAGDAGEGTGFGMFAGKQIDVKKDFAFCNGHIYAAEEVEGVSPDDLIPGCSEDTWTVSATDECGDDGVLCRDELRFIEDVPGCPGGGYPCTVEGLIDEQIALADGPVIVVNDEKFEMPSGDLGGAVYVFTDEVEIETDGAFWNATLLGRDDIKFEKDVAIGSPGDVDTVIIAEGDIEFEKDATLEGVYLIAEKDLKAKKIFSATGVFGAAGEEISLDKDATWDMTALENNTNLNWAGGTASGATYLVE